MAERVAIACENDLVLKSHHGGLSDGLIFQLRYPPPFAPVLNETAYQIPT